MPQGRALFALRGSFRAVLSTHLRHIASAAAVFLLPGILFASDPGAAPGVGDRVTISESIIEISPNPQPGQPHVVRDTLTSVEFAAPMHVVVSLQMRHAVELHGRLSSGLTVPRNEMEEKYLPLEADYNRVVAWLLGEGFVMDETHDPMRLNIFVHHTVADVARVFQVRFARVASNDGEFTSVVTAPSVPAPYSSVVLGIMGLQPHLRFHPGLVKPFGSPYLAPPDVRTAYNVPSSLTGAGQVIGIIMQGPPPQDADLTLFWTDCDVPQTLSDFSYVTVDGGSAPNDAVEASIDVEWSSGMAPGAKVRFYDIPDLSDVEIVAGLTQLSIESHGMDSNIQVRPKAVLRMHLPGQLQRG